MKITKILSLLLAILMLASLIACTPTPPASNDTPGDNTGDNGDGGNETPEYETITIAQALELCGEPGNITTERYYIRATIKTVVNAAYGQMVIQDETGEISVYGTYSGDMTINIGQNVVLTDYVLNGINGMN